MYHKIIKYPGIKEGIYLWIKYHLIHKQRSQFAGNEVNIYIRPEPLTAQYYKGDCNFLDKLISDLQFKYKVTILTRNIDQYKHYSSSLFSNIILPNEPLGFDEIASQCTLFIGAGGSMTRELAILGIPTISVYQDDLLEVDKLLIANNLMEHHCNLSVETIDKLVFEKPILNRFNSLLQDGEIAYNVLKKTIILFDRDVEIFNKKQ